MWFSEKTWVHERWKRKWEGREELDDDDEMIFRHITFDASSQVENYSHETRIFLTLTFTYISFSDADHGVETELLMESTSFITSIAPARTLSLFSPFQMQ